MYSSTAKRQQPVVWGTGVPPNLWVRVTIIDKGRPTLAKLLEDSNPYMVSSTNAEGNLWPTLRVRNIVTDKTGDVVLHFDFAHDP